MRSHYNVIPTYAYYRACVQKLSRIFGSLSVHIICEENNNAKVRRRKNEEARAQKMAMPRRHIIIDNVGYELNIWLALVRV